MRAENLTCSLIVSLFIGTTILILAKASALTDDDANRNSDESNLDHGMNMNSLLSNRDDSMKFIPTFEKRRIGSEFLGKRTSVNLQGMQSNKRRALGSEFLGKRRLGSEFLGKRGFNPENQPEDYQFQYSNIPEEEEDYNNGLDVSHPPKSIYVPTWQNNARLQPFHGLVGSANVHDLSTTHAASNDNESNYDEKSALWNKVQVLKRGLGSEFLGKRDLNGAPAFNLINRWNRMFGSRLPIDHDKKRKLMGSEFLG